MAKHAMYQIAKPATVGFTSFHIGYLEYHDQEVKEFQEIVLKTLIRSRVILQNPWLI